jgi:chromate transporter
MILVLWSLFITFFKIGCMSFGGGYAMLPVIQHEVELHHWLTPDAFNHAVVLAGTGPGPIAANSATLIGYKTGGFGGAIAATLGMILPSLLLIVALAAFLYKWHDSKWFKAVFYGLRPVVTGFIFFAAIRFGGTGMDRLHISWHQAGTAIIVIGVIIAVLKYKLHPLAVIVMSGIMGIVFFY